MQERIDVILLAYRPYLGLSVLTVPLRRHAPDKALIRYWPSISYEILVVGQLCCLLFSGVVSRSFVPLFSSP